MRFGPPRETDHGGSAGPARSGALRGTYSSVCWADFQMTI